MPKRAAQLSLASAIVIWLLVVAGGIVRVTGSGLGCGPDWPLCNGAVIPAFTLPTFIEWAHRLIAAAGSALVLATVFVGWRSVGRRSAIRWLAGGTGLTLLVQILLGAVTVKLDLAFQVVAIHLGVAAVMLALLAAMATIARSRGRVADTGGGLARLALATTAATYLLILIGAYMMGSGGSLGCTTFPLCDGGQVLPTVSVARTHMLHRYAALGVGLLLAATAIQARRRRPDDRSINAVVAAAGALYLGQVAVGIGNVLWSIPPTLRVAHLALAFALWAALVVLCVLARSRPGTSCAGERGHPLVPHAAQPAG